MNKIGMTVKRAVTITLLALTTTQSLAYDRIPGQITKVYSESSVFTFTVTGNVAPQPCGGVFFRVDRSTNPHFKELYALALAAFMAKSNVEIILSGCVGDRAAVDHMAIY